MQEIWCRMSSTVLVFLCFLCFYLFQCTEAGSVSVEVKYTGIGGCIAAECATGTQHMDSYICDTSPGWNNGTRQFQDPIPGHYSITNLTVYVYGVFGCNKTKNSSKRALMETKARVLHVYLQDGLIGEVPVDFSPAGGCICKNCVSNGSTSRPNLHDWAKYAHGANNTITITADTFDICLSIVTLKIDYDDSPPTSSSGTDVVTTTGATGSVTTTTTTATSATTTTTAPGKQNTTSTTEGPDENQKHELVVLGMFMLGGMVAINVLVVGGWYAWRRANGYSNGNNKGDGYETIPGHNNNGNRRRGSHNRHSGAYTYSKALSINDVVLVERIGRGSFGEVYRGIWLQTEVAVKKLPQEILANPSLVEEFNREVKLLRSLMHPNILQFMGSCHVPPDICLITEYMPRGDLYKIIHDASVNLDWALIRRLMLDVARGMNYLHSSNPVVIHRDLKSHNVLVGQHWNAKVADFGLCKIIRDRQQDQGKYTPCGTPKWAAPEVLRNDHYTTKADVYSFGVILWEMATRQDPFPGLSAFELIVQVGKHRLRPQLTPGIYPPLLALITECWDDDPDRRPTFERLIYILESM